MAYPTNPRADQVAPPPPGRTRAENEAPLSRNRHGAPAALGIPDNMSKTIVFCLGLYGIFDVIELAILSEMKPESSGKDRRFARLEH